MEQDFACALKEGMGMIGSSEQFFELKLRSALQCRKQEDMAKKMVDRSTVERRIEKRAWWDKTERAR